MQPITAIGIGDEGGFAPPISHPHEALDLLTTAVGNCSYTGKVKFAIDPASSEFYNEREGTYNMGFKAQGKSSSSEKDEMKSKSEMIKLYHGLMDKYPIVLLEDPFAQDDWEAWTQFNSDCPIPLVGDDLLATNKKRIEMAKGKNACNALLLKINQIGTITEAIEAYIILRTFPHIFAWTNRWTGRSRHTATAGRCSCLTVLGKLPMISSRISLLV